MSSNSVPSPKRIQRQEIATKLLELFGPRGKHWTQNALAKNRYGNAVSPHSKTAISWCLLGGLRKLRADENALPNPWFELPNFNDHARWLTIKSWLEGIANAR